ncbi:uracil-DNA glycosylase [Jeongeupia naejangsanensis]|uniref:Type-4 uracil-DNA glycosylase n=1 Tax=Jeongeupia naejangsanensis TaxID=613195 RepID=A0ABS2BIV6_9NEIS|nr:uracil-DNA glycosylase [Jeongeupia naejangsanensis]MBM3115375.1 uracil-DNA glycosylase [Jeongeupia naejangsanensis]
MSRHALDELGLGPIWIRRDQLAALARDAEPDEAPAPAASPVRDARQAVVALSGTATTASPVAKTSRAPVVTVPDPRTRPAPVESAPPGDSARSRDIAAMDWETLEASIRSCTACALCENRSQAVPGIGDRTARLLIVGEAPGAEEDKRGEPFVGAAGKLLDNMLAAINEKRGDGVYIANVLKCRPPGNRNPQPAEVAECAPYLARQIALIRPTVIFAIGRFAIQTLLQTDAPISALRGKVHRHGEIPVVISYHPAYLLRNLPDKAKAWQDLLLLSEQLATANR